MSTYCLTCIIIISLVACCWCLCSLETYSVTKSCVCTLGDTDRFVMTLSPTPVCLSLACKYWWSLSPGFVLGLRSRCCWFILFPSSLPTWRRGGFLQLLPEQRIVQNILRCSLQPFLPVHLNTAKYHHQVKSGLTSMLECFFRVLIGFGLLLTFLLFSLIFFISAAIFFTFCFGFRSDGGLVT